MQKTILITEQNQLPNARCVYSIKKRKRVNTIIHCEYVCTSHDYMKTYYFIDTTVCMPSHSYRDTRSRARVTVCKCDVRILLCGILLTFFAS